MNIPIKYVTVLGIDPGTKTGLGIYTLHPDTLEIEEISSMTLDLTKIRDHPIMSDARPKFVQHTSLYYKFYFKVFMDIQPDLVIMEDIFVNQRFAQSGLSLAAISTHIENALTSSYNSFLKIYKLSPFEVKKFILPEGKFKKSIAGDKSAINIALKQHQNVKVADYVKLHDTTEHEDDALVLGLYGVELLRNNNSILFSDSESFF